MSCVFIYLALLFPVWSAVNVFFLCTSDIRLPDPAYVLVLQLSTLNFLTWQLRAAGWTPCVTYEYELVPVCRERESIRGRRGVPGAWQGCLSEKSELVVSFRVSCPAVSLAEGEREGLRALHNTALVL